MNKIPLHSTVLPGLKFSIILLLLFSLIVCYKTENQTTELDEFADVLNIKNIPQQPEDWSAFCFSDLGAWHGYALPADTDTAYWGGFIGPFLMTNGRWLSRSFIQFRLFDVSRNCPIRFYQHPKSSTIRYLPGLLQQHFEADSLSIQLELCFISNRSTLVLAKIVNRAANPVQLNGSWQGDVFNGIAQLRDISNGIAADLANSQAIISLQLPDNLKTKIVIADSENSYSLTPAAIFQLNPGDTLTTCIAQTFQIEDCDAKKESIIITAALQQPDCFIAANAKRWHKYLQDVLTIDSQWNRKPYRRIAVKAIQTLINNWRSPLGALYNDGLFPSYAIRYFNGFWAWDSWKHSAALAIFAPALAKNQVRAMFDYQDKNGMIPDVIYTDSTENNWRDTKPPLAAWAIWRIYEETGDRDFIAEMFPQLIRYHQWWYNDRDHDQNGLCEYGSTDGTLIAAKWESGMDNAIRFDSIQMVRNHEGAYSMDQESVDLSAYLYAEKVFLAKMAQVLDDSEKSQQIMEDAERLKSLIQNQMFDKESGYFYDIRLDDKSFVKIQSPEGWIPLWAGVATPEQAQQVKQVICDTTKFATYYPFPTVAKDDPKFSMGYWRGPVWLDQAYFGVKALEQYGFNKEAETFTQQIFERAEGLIGSAPIRENYQPLTGAGLRVNHFSWSAAHLLLLFTGK